MAIDRLFFRRVQEKGTPEKGSVCLKDTHTHQFAGAAMFVYLLKKISIA